MSDDVLLNKAQTIELCIRRIETEYGGKSDNLRKNQTKQDAIILNLARASQAAIDIGMRIVRIKKLGIPKESREVFEILFNNYLISESLLKKMYGVVGFRNTAIYPIKSGLRLGAKTLARPCL